jgi:hypothetical protein
VNANKITDKLSIRVASLNGLNAETAAKQQLISIADLDGYRLAKYGRTYRIGDAGPAGGLICYGGLQAPDYFEVAPAAFEFTVSWDDAVKKYRALTGSDVGDGRLPSQAELDVMYRDFKLKGRGDFKDDWYWFSGGYQNFSDGNQSGSTSGECRVRPVRTVDRSVEEERTLAAKWMAELRQWGEDYHNSPESWYRGEHTIGDIGPAGGHVFYDAGPNASRGRRFLEVAPASTEFRASWNNAVERCKALMVNDIGGWWLPTEEEFNFIYTNFRKIGIGNIKTGIKNKYWSSTQQMNVSHTPPSTSSPVLSMVLNTTLNPPATSQYGYWYFTKSGFGKSSSVENHEYLVRAVREF